MQLGVVPSVAQVKKGMESESSEWLSAKVVGVAYVGSHFFRGPELSLNGCRSGATKPLCVCVCGGLLCSKTQDPVWLPQSLYPRVHSSRMLPVSFAEDLRVDGLSCLTWK